MRIDPESLRALEREARRTGSPLTSLAAELLEDGLVMRVYPGIYLRQSSRGRRPALMGHRIDVQHVVETLAAEGGDLQRAAEHFGVAVGLIRSAMEYYTDHRAAVDAAIASDREFALEAERRWRASPGSATA